MKLLWRFVAPLLLATPISIVLPAFGDRIPAKTVRQSRIIAEQHTQPEQKGYRSEAKPVQNQSGKDTKLTADDVIASVASNGTLQIDAYAIAGGGGTSTSGAFELSGTIGEPAAGAQLSAPGFGVSSGFWATGDVQVVTKRVRGQITSQ